MKNLGVRNSKSGWTFWVRSPTKHPIQRVPGLFPGSKTAGHLAPKLQWIYTSTPTRCLYVVDKEQFVFFSRV